MTEPSVREKERKNAGHKQPQHRQTNLTLLDDTPEQTIFFSSLTFSSPFSSFWDLLQDFQVKNPKASFLHFKFFLLKLAFFFILLSLLSLLPLSLSFHFLTSLIFFRSRPPLSSPSPLSPSARAFHRTISYEHCQRSGKHTRLNLYIISFFPVQHTKYPSFSLFRFAHSRKLSFSTLHNKPTQSVLTLPPSSPPLLSITVPKLY